MALRYFILLSIVSDFNIAWPAINKIFFTFPRFLRLDFVRLFDSSCLMDISLYAESVCAGAAALQPILLQLQSRIRTDDCGGIVELHMRQRR